MISSRLGFRERRYLALGGAASPAMQAASRLLGLGAVMHIASADALAPELEACRIGARAQPDAAELARGLGGMRLHGAVIAAAPGGPAGLLDGDAAEWEDAMARGFLAPLRLVRGLLAGGGLAAGASLVFCLADEAAGGLAAAAASAALQQACFHGRRELLQAGVRVNFLAGADLESGPVLFLLSDASRWMTGSLMVADRGRGLRKVPLS